MTRLAPLAAAAALAGCIPEEGPMMEPGSDCMECHSPGGEARAWTVAGTFGSQGSHVTFTDQHGWTITLRANRAGNFYTAEPVALPLKAISVDGRAMPANEMARAATLRNPGSCNAATCHNGGGGGGD
jgi:hypothetical protein